MGDDGKLFVGGLNFDTTEDVLEDAFSKYGKILKVDVILDRESHRSRGFGFVTFENPDDAKTAMEGMNGKSLDGRQIRVDEAGKSGSRSGGGGGGGGGSGGYRGGSGGYRGGRGGRGGYGGGDRSYGDRSYGSGGDRGYSGGYSQRSSGYSGSGSYSGGGGGGGGGGSGYRDGSQNYDRSYSRESYDS